MSPTIIFNAKTLLKKRWFKRLAVVLLSFSFLSLVFLALLPVISKSFSQTAPKPQSPNYFAVYLNHTLDLNILNDFKLIIPRLDLNVNVSPAVDPYAPQTWQQALKQGVAHTLGSALPDSPGTVYIFGHSTDYPWNINTYNALFYSLNDLQPNDQIFISYQKNRYAYRVIAKHIIAADDLSFLNSGQNRLILQTCWPPGTTLKRLIVEAEPIDI